MKILLVLIIICLLLIAYNQMQAIPVLPPAEPATTRTTMANTPIPTHDMTIRMTIREHIYWQESEEYRHWRTSVKSSIEDARMPESSGRWVREYYWSYE